MKSLKYPYFNVGQKLGAPVAVVQPQPKTADGLKHVDKKPDSSQSDSKVVVGGKVLKKQTSFESSKSETVFDKPKAHKKMVVDGGEKSSLLGRPKEGGTKIDGAKIDRHYTRSIGMDKEPDKRQCANYS